MNTKMKKLHAELESTLLAHGAAQVGIADISALPETVRDDYHAAISIAVALDPLIIEGIKDGPTLPYFNEYQRANTQLAELCQNTVSMLADHGITASAIEPTVAKVDENTLFSRLPHKTVATRAGMGWVGKSALLITRDYGPAIRLGTVLVDADFEAASPVNYSRCGECTRCVDACPAGAIVGADWDAGMERAQIFDAVRCFRSAEASSRKLGLSTTICGICISVCPWTQRYISRMRAELRTRGNKKSTDQ